MEQEKSGGAPGAPIQEIKFDFRTFLLSHRPLAIILNGFLFVSLHLYGIIMQFGIQFVPIWDISFYSSLIGTLAFCVTISLAFGWYMQPLVNPYPTRWFLEQAVSKTIIAKLILIMLAPSSRVAMTVSLFILLYFVSPGKSPWLLIVVLAITIIFLGTLSWIFHYVQRRYRQGDEWQLTTTYANLLKYFPFLVAGLLAVAFVSGLVRAHAIKSAPMVEVETSSEVFEAVIIGKTIDSFVFWTERDGTRVLPFSNVLSLD